jgi:hypothetical protein
LHWVPVTAPELGYWRVKVNNIRVGNESLGVCDDGGCHAILDTGTSLLGVPRQGLRSLLALTARPAAESVKDCRSVPGPPMVFDLEGFSVRLDAADYSRPAVSHIGGSTIGGAVSAADHAVGGASSTTSPKALCRASLLPVDLPGLGPKVFLFGEPVLRKYYTAYDLRQHRVGFALAAEPQPPAVVAPGSTSPSPKLTVARAVTSAVLDLGGSGDSLVL